MKRSLYVVALLSACATTRTSSETPASFAHAYSDAIEARDVELPTRVRTTADIVLVARARDAMLACAAGKSPRFSDAWLRTHGAEIVSVQEQKGTIESLAKDCATMVDKLERRDVKACAVRYVKLDRGPDGIAHAQQTSTGWYMTPCGETHGAHRAGKETQVVRDACQSPTSTVYLVAPWKAVGMNEAATAACFLPEMSRSDWLPGNPGLGIK